MRNAESNSHNARPLITTKAQTIYIIPANQIGPLAPHESAIEMKERP
jgi:hypothetical protein